MCAPWKSIGAPGQCAAALPPRGCPGMPGEHDTPRGIGCPPSVGLEERNIRLHISIHIYKKYVLKAS